MQYHCHILRFYHSAVLCPLSTHYSFFKILGRNPSETELDFLRSLDIEVQTAVWIGRIYPDHKVALINEVAELHTKVFDKSIVEAASPETEMFRRRQFIKPGVNVIKLTQSAFVAPSSRKQRF